ncbi:peptidylprolyl isomerase [Marinicella sp. S1101]|uniref:peptidylprolyl isomerase n=1 Tax=Marinicella marina TaxID=2996016 RepID=UPI002260F16C|nr:peptidylprolyl isomerase [Marinicella marina]MCX7554774.1 peptidylprolyl isomerase [Marinicella marina]MDJ1140993.1 peptidylprolyl isomerase [Marinicella marina]
MKKITFMCLLLSFIFSVNATTVRFETTLGDIEIELFDEQAPVTVENFLNYVNRGDYDNTVFHRTVPGFVVQGGGFRFLGNNQFQTVQTDDPIINEAQISNTIGTIAMARLSDPNSATNQWFFNVANNQDLDSTNSSTGFTVFGEVSSGLETVFTIESLLRINYFDATPQGVFGEFPVYRFSFDNNAVTETNMVKIIRAYQLSDTFQINFGLSGAWFNPATNGQGLYLEVLPSADTVIVGWYTFDDEADPTKAIGDASNRWLTAAGSFDGNSFVGDVFKTSGGRFDDPQNVSTTRVGSMSIDFNDCSTAVFSYDLQEPEVANTMNIQRISGANVALCEELANAANTGVTAQ